MINRGREEAPWKPMTEFPERAAYWQTEVRVFVSASKAA